MTGQERDYDEVLSRVLHSTTDHIEPVGDGLTKIQARLAEPWLKRQWWLLRSEFTTIGWVLAVRCQSWFNQMRSGSAAGADAGAAATGKASASVASDDGRLRSLPVIGGIAARAAAKRPRHASSRLRNSVGPAMVWLRPALAVAGAIVHVVAGVFAMGGLQGAGLFGSYANSNVPSTGPSSHAGEPGITNGSGSQAPPGSAPTPQPSTTPTEPSSTPSGQGGGAPGPVLSPAAASPSGSPSSSPTSGNSSPTATPTSTPTPSPTPTPTPTATLTTPGASP